MSSTGDFTAARGAAEKALALAQTLIDRETALVRGAQATNEQARRRRLAGTCSPDGEAIQGAITDLRKAIDAGGPVLDSSRALLNAALMAGDRATMAQAWRWYFGDVPSVVPPLAADRRSVGLALATARLFPEAELVLRDRCVPAVPATDEAIGDVLAYAAALERLSRIAITHYRAVAKGAEDDGAFERAVGAEAAALWGKLTWPDQPPPFSTGAFSQETDRRFGTISTVGRTDSILTLLLGHKLIDERRDVEQYGHRAPLRFVLLDGMVSSGYMAWATHNRAGTGGWIGSDAIYQIRPMYADGAVARWRRLTDSLLRARRDEEIREETSRDIERAKESPIRYFRGLDLRLQHQAVGALHAQLVAEGLSGDALREAFLQRAHLNEFDSSIWAHEGRHAIDKLIFKITDSPELEFRAKISEVVLAAIPRGELATLLSPIGPPTAHGIANRRLLEGVVAWMRGHASEIARLDRQTPLLPQLDKLTDAQLRTAFRSLDPLARARAANPRRARK